MDYLVLNFESIPFQSKEDADKRFPDFLSILDFAFKKGITTIRTENKYGKGWFDFLLAENYFLRNWLDKQEKEYILKIKTIISKTEVPLIPADENKQLAIFELSEYHLSENPEIKTPSLGAAHLLKQTAISFYSNEYWNKHQIGIEKYEIDSSSGKENSSSVLVDNITTLIHWDYYLNLLNIQRKESLLEGNNLWTQRKTEYPNLIFCGETEYQFKKFNFSKNTTNKVINIFGKMNSFCENNKKNFTVENFRNITQLNFSPESQPVQDNEKLRALRKFRNPNGEKEYFKWHIKNIPNTRLYFQFDFEQKQILIGYIGKHLPT